MFTTFHFSTEKIKEERGLSNWLKKILVILIMYYVLFLVTINYQKLNILLKLTCIGIGDYLNKFIILITNTIIIY